MRIIDLRGIKSAVPYQLPASAVFVVVDKPIYFRIVDKGSPEVCHKIERSAHRVHLDRSEEPHE